MILMKRINTNMKIQFESWLEINDIPEEAQTLFEESIRCYKISAYRSAFIMSYIAFQIILKKRILNAKQLPPNINQNCWNTICSKLGDDDTWDSEVADCVKRSSPDRIFIITNPTVSEYEAYRVIRNKCAHGKTGTIDHFHVESFWNFIQENFYRFVVYGGKAGLLQDIENHYDHTITPPGKDVSYIIDRIKIGIRDDDLYDLIKDFYVFCEKDQTRTAYFFSDKNSKIDLWDKLVNESNDRIQETVIKFIKEEKGENLCDFAKRYPSTIDMFLSDMSFARKLWTVLLPKNNYPREGFWNIIERLIVNRSVPISEQNDFDNNLYKCVGLSYPKERIEILKLTGYFKIVDNYLFEPSKYDYPNGINHANSISAQFVAYIHDFGLSKESVECINHIFSFATYGNFYNAVCEMMKKQELLVGYQRIVKDNNLLDMSNKFTIIE